MWALLLPELIIEGCSTVICIDLIVILTPAEGISIYVLVYISPFHRTSSRQSAVLPGSAGKEESHLKAGRHFDDFSGYGDGSSLTFTTAAHPFPPGGTATFAVTVYLSLV